MSDDERKALFRAKLEQLFAAHSIPVKKLFVGAATINVTLFGEAHAREVAALVEPFTRDIRVGVGFDQGQATEVRNGRRKDVQVWRVFAFIGK